MSASRPYFLPSNTSGAMVRLVPNIVFVVAYSLVSYLANPRSAILISLSCNRMLASLRLKNIIKNL